MWECIGSDQYSNQLSKTVIAVDNHIPVSVWLHHFCTDT